jgi:hypothetical protein
MIKIKLKNRKTVSMSDKIAEELYIELAKFFQTQNIYVYNNSSALTYPRPDPVRGWIIT